MIRHAILFVVLLGFALAAIGDEATLTAGERAARDDRYFACFDFASLVTSRSDLRSDFDQLTGDGLLFNKFAVVADIGRCRHEIEPYPHQ